MIKTHQTKQKKEEIGSPPEKEFRMTKMIQNFENKMKLQINSRGTRIEKMQNLRTPENS